MTFSSVSLETLARLRRKHFLIAAAILPLVVLFFFLSVEEPICVGDCDGYTLLMGASPWKITYWRVLRSAFRSWTLPVLYSLFGPYNATSAHRIVVAQAVLLLAATITFAVAVASRFDPEHRWWIGFAVATTLAFQQGYLVFSSFLLSDALAWTLVLLLLATVVAWDSLLDRFGFLPSAVCYLTLGGMAIGARDANQQLLILLTAYLLIRGRARLTRTQKLALVAGVACLCLEQAHWAARRFSTNIESVLIGRILPDPDRREFFLRHGMPPAYAELGKTLPQQPLGTIDKDVVTAGRIRFEPLDHTYLRVAPRTYALWMLTHPGQVAHIVAIDRSIIFGNDFVRLHEARLQLATVARRLETGSAFDHRPETPTFDLRQRLLVLRPTFLERSPIEFRLALILAIVAWGLGQGARVFLGGIAGFALVMILLGSLNACSGFLADYWEMIEMQRHAAVGSMMLNAGTLILILWALQCAARSARSRR